MSQLIAGTTSMVTVRSVCGGIRHALRRDDWIVVRSIDSTRNVVGVQNSLRFLGVEHALERGNVCVPVHALPDLLRDGVLPGFDEVWVFLGAPPPHDLSEGTSLTSEATDFSEFVPAEIAAALASAELLVLGDGCGLNYATNSERLAPIVLGLVNPSVRVTPD